MKQLKMLVAAVCAVLSFLATVLCMRDVLSAQAELQRGMKKTEREI